MIRFGTEEPFIKPNGIKFKEGQDENIKLPKVAIGVFSKILFVKNTYVSSSTLKLLK